MSGSRSSLPDASGSDEAGGSAGSPNDTICRGLTGINRMTIFYTTWRDLTFPQNPMQGNTAIHCMRIVPQNYVSP